MVVLYVPTRTLWKFPFLHILTNTWLVHHFSHSNRCTMLSHCSFIQLFLFFWEREEGEGQRARNIDERDTLLLSCLLPPTGDWDHNQGMYPNWELNYDLLAPGSTLKQSHTSWASFGISLMTSEAEHHFMYLFLFSIYILWGSICSNLLSIFKLVILILLPFKSSI